MTLAQRLVATLSLLVLLATSTLGWFVHQSWRAAEEEQFAREFTAAQQRLTTQLATETAALPTLLEPLCQHSQMVDDPLTSLQSGPIPADRRHALSLLAGGTQRAYRFDEFILFATGGDILGAHDAALVGSKDPTLALLSGTSTQAELVIESGIPKLTAHCTKVERNQTVGLFAGRHVGKMLDEVGALHGLVLSLAPPQDPPRHLERLQLPMLREQALYASPAASWLDAALERSTRAIVWWGALTLVSALIAGWWFARRLAVPMERLASDVQHALEGEPRVVEARGPREVVRFAESFNRAIADLTALRKRLAATERIAAQREIARRVAHEIKNPLAPIRAAIETLRRLRRRNDPQFDGYFDEATETVLSEVQRITAIVNEFTEFARMARPNPVSLDVIPLTQGIVGLHRREGTAVELEVTSPLPHLRADRDQLVQVITNLLQNALDSVAGQPDARVVVRLESRPPEVWISVIDNGPGVPPELRDTLFQPYVTGKSHGTGLGLAIVLTIVTDHGGNVECRDSDGPGAHFRVRLPVSGPASGGEPPPSGPGQ